MTPYVLIVLLVASLLAGAGGGAGHFGERSAPQWRSGVSGQAGLAAAPQGKKPFGLLLLAVLAGPAALAPVWGATGAQPPGVAGVAPFAHGRANPTRAPPALLSIS